MSNIFINCKMSEIITNFEGVDFSKICRVCCSSSGVMVSIFRVHISRKIMALSAVQVWESDGLPGQICNECIVKLDISFQFKKQCEKSDQNLRQYKAILENSKIILKKNSIKEKYFENIPPSNTLNFSEQIECTPDMSAPTVSQNLNVLPSELPISSGELTDLSHSVPLKNEQELMGFSYEDVNFLDLKPDPEGYQCKTCYKVFTSSTKLSRHTYIHSGQKPFQCDICKRAFSHNSNLKAHMKLHSDERPYVCNVCQKGCKRAKDLEMHMRTHTGEKPHSCNDCGRAFSSSSNLIAHQRTHTGEKPYVCSVCEKAFCQSNELSKHKKIHVKEKHVCEICNKSFSGSSALIVHVMNHNEERSNVCTICYKSLDSSKSLSLHLEKHEMGHLEY